MQHRTPEHRTPEGTARPEGSPGTTDSDRETDFEGLLVAIANQRDRGAFERLFNCFARRVYGLGMKIAGNEQMAKDLVQEVMLAVWQNAAAYNLDKGTAKSWIFALSRNKCIDMIRRAKRQPQALASDQVWPEDLCSADDETDFGDNAAVAELDVEKIGRLSHDLPVGQRQAVEMIYIYDHTHEEAAGKLGIPLGTLKSRLRLGLIKLRELIRTAP